MHQFVIQLQAYKIVKFDESDPQKTGACNSQINGPH